VALYANFV